VGRARRSGGCRRSARRGRLRSRANGLFPSGAAPRRSRSGSGPALPAALRRWAADPRQRDRTLWLSSGARTIAASFVRAGGERRHDAIVLRQAGGSPGAGIRRPSLRRERLWEGGLTAREAEVLEHVGHGAMTAQVAGAMSLRPRTVEKHLQHICRKLGVCYRTQALRRLDEHRCGAYAGTCTAPCRLTAPLPIRETAALQSARLGGTLRRSGWPCAGCRRTLAEKQRR